MITPVFRLDSSEQWLPTAVETALTVGAFIDGQGLRDLSQLNSGTHRIDFPDGMTQPANAPVCVYRRVQDGGSLWWAQFWTWWLYNPKEYVGFGAHEGDWEMVQFGCRDPECNVPILATYSQHKTGEKREYWRVEQQDDRPVVYVAEGSHANYFQPHHDLVDDADGKFNFEYPPDNLAREFGPWAIWSGQWGNSDNSPGSLPSHLAWRAPHIFHGQSKG